MFTMLVLGHGALAACSLIALGVVVGPPRLADVVRRARSSSKGSQQ